MIGGESLIYNVLLETLALDVAQFLCAGTHDIIGGGDVGGWLSDCALVCVPRGGVWGCLDLGRLTPRLQPCPAGLDGGTPSMRCLSP